MDTGKQHHMVVKNTFPTGAQEWYCPTCGRHFIIQWPPNYKRIMLNEGDEQVAHAGGTDGVIMGSADVMRAEGDRDPLSNNNSIDDADYSAANGGASDLDDPYLSPWARWISDQDL